jgi:uncharacterized paraquat-inducible protein A
MEIPDQFAGAKADCNSCGRSFTVPVSIKKDTPVSSYVCPRCGRPVQRGSSATSTAAGFAGGLLGMLIYAAFGNFHCGVCGEIPKHEFPPDVQWRMTLGTIGYLLAAVVVLGALITIIVLLQS